MLIEYPVNHEIYAGTPSSASSLISTKLKRNLVDFNKPELLSNSDFTDYAKAFLSFQVSLELKKPVYKNTDNQQLRAVWKLIPEFISNAKCAAFWKSYYLQNHINNDGTKNIETIYIDFKSTCKDTGYLNAVTTAYKADSIGKLGHVIKTYKPLAFCKECYILNLLQCPTSYKKTASITVYIIRYKIDDIIKAG